MIHQYELNGYHIVLDKHSGAVHSVDSLAYDLIAGIDRALTGNPDSCGAAELLGTPGFRSALAEGILSKSGREPGVSSEDIQETLSDIESLIARGQLFSEDPFKDLIPDHGETGERTQVIKALCLHVAHTCNLSCDYCFASQGKYRGEQALMSLAVARNAMDFLVAHSGSRRNLEVDFFGGEPLLNWQVVKDTVSYARELETIHDKKFRFTLTTNGMLLDDEVTEFCNREIDNVVLSLDGRREIHDRLRRTWSDEGSYDTIVPKFQEFVKKRGDKSHYIRGTFTHDNVDFTRDIIHMADLGFRELSMEPVVCSPGEPYALTEEDLPRLYSEYEQLALEMRRREQEGRPFTFYHYMLDLEGGPCIYKRLTGCGSGTEYLAVTPSGDLYPCHQFVGEEAFRMGDLDHGITRPEIVGQFKGCNVMTRPECKDCWAGLYCSGGCAANAWNAKGDIAAVYEYGCKLFKKRMECAIMLKVADALDEEDSEV